MRPPGNYPSFNASAHANEHDITIRPPVRSKSKRRAPFSLALSDEERTRLKAAAGDLPLGTYIKARLFEDLPAVPRQSRRPQAERSVLAKLLGALGQSRLSQNMNQIARASNRGILPLTPELMAELNAACAEIREMRGLLVEALGMRGPSK